MDNYLRSLKPHEEALGILLNNPDIFEEHESHLDPSLFFEHEWLFRLMRKVHKREGYTFQGLVIDDELHPQKMPELRALKDTYFNANRLPALIQRIKKMFIAQRLTGLSQETIERIARAEDPDEVLRLIQDEVTQMVSSDSEDFSSPDRDVEDWVRDMLDTVENPEKAFGLMTGITPLDRITFGFYRQHLSVLGGYTSMGKTAMTIDLLLRMNKIGYRCAFFSLEMSKRDLYGRMMSNLLGVNHRVMKTGKLEKRYYDEMVTRKEELKTIYVDDTRGLTADQICDKIRYLKRKQGLDFVVVDYLQDVSEPAEANENGGAPLGRVCRKLRKVALQCDVHIMALSQIGRSSTQRPDKRPTISDLSGSTGIETAADVIMLIYRDEYFHADTDKKGIIELNFVKQRNGGLGMVELFFDKETQKMRELEKVKK